MPPSSTMRGQALTGNRAAFLAFLAAFLAAALLAGDLSLINRASAPSNAEASAALALQGLSALSALIALMLGIRVLVVGHAARARVLGALAVAIALVALFAWLPAFFGIGL
jgi:hypothetical protein